MTFEKVRQMVMKVPDIQEGTAWGLPTFEVKKKMLLCFRADLGAVAFRATFDQRDAMIEEEPETFFTTDHHRPHPWVLAHVTRLRAAVVRGLIQMALKQAMSEKTRKASKSKWK